MLAGVGIGIYSNLAEPIEKFLKIKKHITQLIITRKRTIIFIDFMSILQII
jgi:hypothetical protein